MLQLLLIIGCISGVVLQSAPSITITGNRFTFRIVLVSNIIKLEVTKGTIVQLKGELGIGLTGPYLPCNGVDNCYVAGNNRLHVTSDVERGITVHWITDNSTAVFKDCFEHGSEQWFGGPERFNQHWPIQKLTLNNFANVAQELEFGAIVEPYWLNSLGAYIFVDRKVPLYIDQNTATSTNKVCFMAKNGYPYQARNKITLKYSLVSNEDVREAHLHAVHNFLGKPTGYPNPRIIQQPIWSTWARYKRDVNDTVLRKFLDEIISNGYPNGQFEIDDDWEDCYGALTFRPSKFSQIKETVSIMKSNNFTVTLWVHPFVNINCSKYTTIGNTYGYFVKDTTGSVLTQWWNSKSQQAQYLDFTKAEVRSWFTERLKSLQSKYGIDSFKFDAGETSWSPQVSVLEGDIDSTPNNIVVDYVRTCAKFGDLVEVRTGWGTQDLPVFVRMIDKDSTWGSNNGLYTLITTMLQMNLNGYTMVLPDMVGGNGYYGKPSAELFVRWLQANTFMPSIQFSYVPWDYVNNDQKIDVLEISKKYVKLHEIFANYIEKQMQKSVSHGYLVNAPIWWIDPTNVNALKEDTEFLLGEDVLVAPVIEEGATYRRVYLPAGTWIDGNTREVHTGPKEIKTYNATIGVLPYFIKNGSEVDADQFYMVNVLTAPSMAPSIFACNVSLLVISVVMMLPYNLL